MKNDGVPKKSFFGTLFFAILGRENARSGSSDIEECERMIGR